MFLAGIALARSRLFVPQGSRWAAGGWGLAWIAMFLSVAVFVGHTYTSDSVSLDRAALIQLAWVGLACLLLALSLAGSRPWIGLLASAPIWLFLAYGLGGIATSMFSPRPLFSAYKAGLVVVDALLAAGLLSLALRGRLKRVSNLMIALVMLAIGGALLGAVLWPAEALQPKPGVFGVMLYGVLPMLHPNELGMWAGIVTVISFARGYVGSRARVRWGWFLLCAASVVVVLLAQSRTSVAAILLSLLVLVPYLARTRATAVAGLAALGLIGVSLIGIVAVLVGPEVLFGPIIDYLQRGQDEGGLATLHGRIWAWANVGWPMFMESPVFGHGFDAGVRFASNLTVGHLHNSYFQVLANSGLLGFIPWFAAFVITSVRVVQHAWRYRSAPTLQRIDALVPLLILIGLLARSWTGSVLVSHAWSTMIFLAMAVDVYANRLPARAASRVQVAHAVGGGRAV